jgi:hypothetical protein
MGAVRRRVGSNGSQGLLTLRTELQQQSWSGYVPILYKHGAETTKSVRHVLQVNRLKLQVK